MALGQPPRGTPLGTPTITALKNVKNLDNPLGCELDDLRTLLYSIPPPKTAGALNCIVPRHLIAEAKRLVDIVARASHSIDSLIVRKDLQDIKEQLSALLGRVASHD